MPKPVTLPLDIYEGDTFKYPFRIRELPAGSGPYVDLTDHTAKAQLRSSSGTLVMELTCVVDADQVTNRGLVTLSLTKVQTTGLKAAAGNGPICDVEITNPATERRTYIKFSPITITTEVTKDA